MMETLFPSKNSSDYEKPEKECSGSDDGTDQNSSYEKPVKEGGKGDGVPEQNSAYEKPVKEGDNGPGQSSSYEKPVKEGGKGEDGPEQSSKSCYLLPEEKKKIQVAVGLTPELNTNGSSSSSSNTDQVRSSTSSNATNHDEPSSQMSHSILPPSFSMITSTESSSILNDQDGLTSLDRVDNSNKTVKKRFLFKKALTISDTGKYNRLLIPRKDAEEYFPPLKQGNGNDKKPPMKLKFSDINNKTWEMKFEFWKRSKCYVLSTGWKKFVTEYKLKPPQKVEFYKIEEVSEDNNLFIDFEGSRSIKLFGVKCMNGTKGENGEADHKRKMTQTGSSSKRQRKRPTSNSN